MDLSFPPDALTVEQKFDYLLHEIEVLRASNDNLQLVINELRKESDASFIPLLEVCGEGKPIPKNERTVRRWLFEYRLGKENYHYRRSGRLILVHVERVNDLLSGRG
jgi:hypothetical protein